MPTDRDPPRTLTTLLLVAHCFTIVVVLAANLKPSPLQSKLVSLVAPYARSLNFDPNFTPYHLTHGHIENDDHRIVVDAAYAEGTDESARRSIELPDVGLRGGLRRRRYQVLGARIAYFANRELDTISAEFIKAIGTHFINAMEFDRAVITCRVHRAQPIELDRSTPADPMADAYMEDVYAADVWLAEDDSVQLLKRSSTRESAPAAGLETVAP